VKCPECTEGESGGAAVEAREDFLRLQSISGLQFRGVGAACGGEMSGLRKSLYGREILKAGAFFAAVRMRSVSISARFVPLRWWKRRKRPSLLRRSSTEIYGHSRSGGRHLRIGWLWQ